MRFTALLKWNIYHFFSMCGLLSFTAANLVIVSDFRPPAIYIANLGSTLKFRKINIDNGRNITEPFAVDYDPIDKKIYWTQHRRKWTGEGLIARCDLNGNAYEEVIRDLEFAVGLALDVVGRKMYFSHEGMALESANLDGSVRTTVIRELPTTGFYVFFDSVGKRIFWTDTAGKKIESAKIDGTNRTVHVDGLLHPSAIFVDGKAKQIYWADFGTDTVATSNYTGITPRTLYTYPLVSTETHPNAMGMYKNEIYLLDRSHHKLQKIPKNIRKGQIIKPQDVGNIEFGWPSGLHIYESGSQQLMSASLGICLLVPMILQKLL